MASNYAFNFGRQANGQRIIQEIQRGALPTVVAVNMTNSVVSALQSIGPKLTRVTNDIARSLQQGAVIDSYLKDANESLAHGAQRAIVNGWRSRLPVGAPGYRAGGDPNRDRLSGVLGEVLASPEMLRGTTARTISFLNTGALNTEARHWYRVNYGALGPKVHPKAPEAYPVTAEGHTLFVLRDEAPPAPNSWLPRDWVSEGTRYFAPKAGPADVHGGGHRAALFTDLGFEYLGANFYPTYAAMFLRYRDAAIGRTKLQAIGVDVNTDLRIGSRPVSR